MKNNQEKILLPITGIGSVPHDKISEAVEFSCKFHIPFLPQMTSLKELMVEQAQTGEYLSLEIFSNKMNRGQFPHFKVQIAGPFSSKVEIPQIIHNIEKLIFPFEISPIVFIDEPIFDKNLKYLEILIESLKKTKLEIGIHCCNQYDLNLLLGLNINYLSIDGEHLLEVQNIPEISTFFKHDRKLILGIIPTNKSYQEDEIYEKYFHFIKSNYKKIILSPACGLAGMTKKDAQKCLQSLLSLRQRFINEI